MPMRHTPMLGRTLGGLPHPPGQSPPQRVAQGGDNNRRPKQIGAQLDQPKHGWLRPHWQQGGRDKGNDENGPQANLRYGKQRQKRCHAAF